MRRRDAWEDACKQAVYYNNNNYIKRGTFYQWWLEGNLICASLLLC